MGDYNFLLSLVILFPFLSWLIRRKNMDPAYWPFFTLITLGLITELTGEWSIRLFKTNAVVVNLYSLLECLLIVAQFYCWRGNTRLRRRYLAVAAAMGLTWLMENFVWGHIVDHHPVFRISYAFAVVILTINEINYLITHASRHLLRNARFLICLGFLIFFLYQTLVEGAIQISNIEQQRNYTTTIFNIQVYINVLVNIVYGIAIWYIPKRSTFNFPVKSTGNH